MSLSLLGVAKEVQVMIFQYITRPSDLATLCLISKELSAIAFSALYYQVDLTPREKTQAENRDELNPIPLEQIRRLQALLSNKRNLKEIRVLITSECDSTISRMLNELFANLAEDQLLELHYGNRGMLVTNSIIHRTENCFPSEEQMELIWARQRNLQTCHSQHLSTLSRALNTNRLEASVVLRPLKELALIEEQLDPRLIDLVKRSLQNGYMPALRKLKLAQWRSDRLQSLHDVFAAGAFRNLTEIYLRECTFRTPLHLANCPMLRSISIINCRILPDRAATLSIPHGQKIRSLHYAADADIDQYKLLAAIMNQIQGLESLVLELISPESEDEDFAEEQIDQFRSELAYALSMHQSSLTELVVCEQQDFESVLTFAGDELFLAIQGCEKLFRLAVALSVDDPVPRYCQLIRELPSLAYCWFMSSYNYDAAYENEAEIPIQFINALPATSNLRFLGYTWYCYSRQQDENDESSSEDELGANTAGPVFEKINWKVSNAAFYNRYPCVPLLPVNREPPATFLATLRVCSVFLNSTSRSKYKS